MVVIKLLHASAYSSITKLLMQVRHKCLFQELILVVQSANFFSWVPQFCSCQPFFPAIGRRKKNKKNRLSGLVSLPDHIDCMLCHLKSPSHTGTPSRKREKRWNTIIYSHTRKGLSHHCPLPMQSLHLVYPRDCLEVASTGSCPSNHVSHSLQFWNLLRLTLFCSSEFQTFGTIRIQIG